MASSNYYNVDWHYSLSGMRLEDMPFGWIRANLYFFLDKEGLLNA